MSEDCLLKGYPKGSDITILNCFYNKPSKNEETGKKEDDFLTVLFRDNKTGKKKHQVVTKPTYEYFISKETPDYPLLFIEKDKVDSHIVPFNQVVKDIAEQTGNQEYFYNNISNGNWAANKELHTLYNVFNSDQDICDNFRFRFGKYYTNSHIPLVKSYFDIEVDGINAVGDFPMMGECPINAVSYIYKNQVYSFLLRNPDNPLVEEFEKSIDGNLMKELDDFIIENVGGPKKTKRYGLDSLEYNFIFFDEEIKLIQDLFALINTQEPDFLLAWNMAFDIPYIMERLKALGYNPRDIIAHPSFGYGSRSVADYFIDEQHGVIYEARGDNYSISSHTVYLDQLIHFASRRKGQAAFPDFKLDTAGSIIAGVRKLDYSHITTRLAELPYLNYKVFVFYNIMDTIVQKCIEEKTQDIDFVFNKCLINNTRYEKCHRQTVYLINRATKSFDNDGFIIGNNQNRHTQAVPFPGALVGDPLNNSDYSKLKHHGQTLNIIDNSADFDYKSLYPNDDTYFNMAPNTQEGKIIIDHQVHNLENPFNMEFYDRGGQFIQDFVSYNFIEFCRRWFNFPSFREWLEDLQEYCVKINPYPIITDPTRAFFTYEADHINAFAYIDEPVQRAFMTYPDKLDYSNYLNKINYGM